MKYVGDNVKTKLFMKKYRFNLSQNDKLRTNQLLKAVDFLYNYIKELNSEFIYRGLQVSVNLLYLNTSILSS